MVGMRRGRGSTLAYLSCSLTSVDHACMLLGHKSQQNMKCPMNLKNLRANAQATFDDDSQATVDDSQSTTQSASN